MGREMDQQKKIRGFMFKAGAIDKYIEVLEKLEADGVTISPAVQRLVLDEMAKAGYMDMVFDTGRSHDQIVEDYRKRGFIVDDRRVKDDTGSEDNWKRAVVRFFRKLAGMVKVFVLGSTKRHR